MLNKDETIRRLEVIKTMTDNCIAQFHMEAAIKEAIRRVELYDELVEALESFLQDGYDHHYCKRVLKKAKELSE